MGGVFIINVKVGGGNFNEISILMRSGFWKNSLNNFFLETSLTMLLMLAFFVASSFNYFFGICGHPSFATQSNVLKTLIVAYGVFSNALTFFSSPFSCTLFSVQVLVDC